MKGIVFDIDDTLYVRQDMIVAAAEDVLGIKVIDPKEFIDIYYAKSDINMDALEAGKIKTRDINGWRYEETFRILGLPFVPGDGVLTADKYLELQSHMSISEDMVKVLDAFKADPAIELAVLTSGKSSHQWNKVGMLGLLNWFDRDKIIVTGDAGISKPDVRLCRMIEERLDLDPKDIWMIGDSYRHDITGAIESGWHCIWINRRGIGSPEIKPDIEVATDEELIKVLKELHKSLS